MSASQILRQAEELKAAVKDTSRGANEAWVSRQNLQDHYQRLLVLDLEYALDKKVEQDLWNHAFKNQISTLQTQAKEKQNPKRPEILASLNLFLETGSGFYLQLLEELCSAFKLDLRCRRKSSAIGIIKEYGPVASKIKAPKKSSCMYICQHCLVHLGDIARYREQLDEAQTYYRHAASLVPYNGQPYNQLAILEAAKGNKLATVMYYVRSIAVKHPFPVASTNLDKFYTKITKDISEVSRKLSVSELMLAFLQFNALLHLSTKLDIAKTLSQRIVTSLPSHITSVSLTGHQILQMATVLLYTLTHLSQGTPQGSPQGKTQGSPQGKSQEKTEGKPQEKPEGKPEDKPDKDKEATQEGYELGFCLMACLLEVLLSVTPVKQESKAKEYHTLPAIKVILDWLRTDSDLINRAQRTNPGICQSLSKLLNILQFNTNQKDVPVDLEKYVSVPLPEDCDLRCFTPLQSAHSDLDFHLMPVEGLSAEVEMRLRCQRLVEHGLWLCEAFPSLNVINVRKEKSGRFNFSVPSSHVRVNAGGSEADGPAERKPSYRQNVAIQAIMLHNAKKDTSGSADSDTKDDTASVSPVSTSSSNDANIPPDSGKTHGNKNQQQDDKSPQKQEASIMVNTSTETQEPLEPRQKHIPSDAWETPEPRGGGPHGQPDPANVSPSSTDQWHSSPNMPRKPYHSPATDHKGTERGIAKPRELLAKTSALLPTVKLQPAKPADRGMTGIDVMDPKHESGVPKEGKPDSMARIQQALYYKQAALMQQAAAAGKDTHPTGPDASLFARQMPDLDDPRFPEQMHHLQQQYIQQQQLHRLKQQQQQQQQHADFNLQTELQHLDKRILQNAELLKQVGQQIQQNKQIPQRDKEWQVLQQQLQQMQIQQQKLVDGRQQQQMQQLISQHEQKLRHKYQQFKDVLRRDDDTQQQLQQQQQQLLQQRQQMVEAHLAQQQKQQQQQHQQQQAHSKIPWPTSQPPVPMNPMVAVMERDRANKAAGTKLWDNQGLISPSMDHIHGTDDPKLKPELSSGRPQMDLPASERTTSLSPGSGKLLANAQNVNTKAMYGFQGMAGNPDSESEPYPFSPNQASQLDTYLGSLFRGPQPRPQDSLLSAPSGYIPGTSDSEEELREVGEKMSSRSSGRDKEVLRPDSSQNTTGSGLFPEDQNMVPYSLFSQSPWTVQITSAESKSATSSPGFGSSSSSSLRTSPDVYTSQPHDVYTSQPDMGTDQRLGPASGGAGAPAPFASGHLNSIWSAGPSPLQKLLEQQKSQRHNDPH